jgi:hypothetical protein
LLKGPLAEPEDENGDAVTSVLSAISTPFGGPEAVLFLGLVENGRHFTENQGELVSPDQSRNFDGISRDERLENQSHPAAGDQKTRRLESVTHQIDYDPADRSGRR